MVIRLLTIMATLHGLTGSSLADLPIPLEQRTSQESSLDRQLEPDSQTQVAEEGGFSFLDSLRDGDHGVAVAPVYYGEVMTNTRGGRSTSGATRYLGLLDLPVTLDFEKMGCPVPGRFFLLGQTTHGEGLTDNFVGDTLVVSNNDSFVNITRVGEYWWEGSVFDDAVRVRLGKQDVNTEFLLIETAEDFIQSTFGMSPSTAFPTYPDQSMAAVVLLELSDSWHARAGIWSAFSSGGNWGGSGNDSLFVVGELQYSYALFSGRLPGKLTLAATDESAGELDGEPLSTVQELSIQLEQFLYRERSALEGDLQGLAVFGGYYPRFPGLLVTDDSIGDSFVAGLVYTGLIPRRDADVMGAGVAWAELYQGGTGQETVIEAYYRARITPRVSLQPDVQYIASPSGIYSDSLVTGVRFELTW